MPRMKILSAMLIMVPATILMTAQGSLGEPAAEPCKASPGGAAPKGMHWYYRINGATNKHCWYLGPVGIHTKSHTTVATGTSEPATARRLNTADADNGLPAKAMTAESSEAAAPAVDAARAQALPQPSPIQTASVQAAPAQVLPAAPAASADLAAADRRFGARWPENLPNAEDVEQAEPAPVSSHAEPGDGANAQPPEPAPVSSHAEPGDGANAQPLEPAPVSSHAEPGDGGANAQPPSNWAGGETALRYVSIAGIVLIPLVLAAGWMAKFARRSHGSDLPQRLRAMLRRLRPHRRRKALDAAAFDEAEFDETAHDEATFDAADEGARRKAAFVGAAPGGPARPGRRASADRRARGVTDPAHDLKKSLTELMHDLRRAAEPQPPARYAQRSYGRAGERVLSPSLQPAE